MSHRESSVPLYLNWTSADEMVRVFDIDRATAEVIVAHRPYWKIGDLLKINQFTATVLVEDLFTILGGASTTFPIDTPLPIGDSAEESAQTGVIYGIKQDISGTKRVFISDSIRNEIISADLDETAKHGIDYTSIRFASYLPWDLLRIHPADRSRIGEFLRDKPCRAAGSLWQDLQGVKKGRHPKIRIDAVSHLSQVLSMFQDLIQEVAHDHAEAEECDSNGCTAVPDFDVKDCCDEHDRCYCRGGDEEERQECDDEFWECIRRKGHPVLAVVYRVGVEALGDSHFNYKVRIDYVKGTPVVEFLYPPSEEAPPTKDCRVTVTLMQVQYKGKNIGNDWSYRVGVEGSGTKILDDGTHNRGATKFYNRTVYEKELPDRCGTSFYINLAADATEQDAIYDDHGSKQVNYQVTCDPNRPFLEYQYDLEVKVKERKWYGFGHNIARLVFTFVIETRCV